MKKRKLSLSAIAILALLIINIALVGFIIGSRQNLSQGRPNEDPSLTKIEGFGSEDLTGREGTQTIDVICAQELTVHTVSRTVELFYQNPASSELDVSLELYVQDNLIASSGIVPAGYQLNSMPLLVQLEASGQKYDGRLKTILYDADGNRISYVDSEIEVFVRIQKD